jgi:hypothetical protein
VEKQEEGVNVLALHKDGVVFRDPDRMSLVKDRLASIGNQPGE